MSRGIRNVVRSTGTVAGNAATKVPATKMANRKGVLIHNPNATYDLWGVMVNGAASAPTISATDRDFVVGQNRTVFVPCSEGLDLYLQNSSGAATTSEYVVSECDESVQFESGPTAHQNLWNAAATYLVPQTNTVVKAAPGVGLSLYITDVYFSNGATAGDAVLKDGAAGSEVWGDYAAINGGGQSNRKTPIKLTANTALVVTSTTVTTHRLSVGGYIAP